MYPSGPVKVTEPPAQNVVGPDAVIAGDGGYGYAVTVNGADVALQPFASLTVTVYVPGPTWTNCVVSPVDQRIVVPCGGDTRKVTMPLPQIDAGPWTNGVGGLELTVTVVGADVALQPFASVVVTV